ncbi:hypothetical protein ACS3SW_20605 [Roseobacteraceae bacterium S113]
MKFSLFFCALVLCGCVGGAKDIVAEYKNTARSIGVTPVYPPEEWLQVGDSFIQSVPKTDGNLGLRSNVNDTARVYFDHSPEVLDAAEKFMSSRVVFLRTEETAGRGGTKSTQRDIPDGSILRRRDLKVETLPIVAFPEVTADAGSNFGFNLVRLFESFGIGAGQRTRVTLNFNDVRKYGVPKLSVYSQSQAATLKKYEDRVRPLIAQFGYKNAVATTLSAIQDTINREIVKENARLRLSQGERSTTPV